MKRKFLLFILTIAFCALCMASFTSCFKHEHSFVLNSATPATCQKPERRIYSCECGETSMEYVGEALEHAEVIDPAVASTCTEPGLTEGKHCSVCEEVLVTQKVVPALGHNFINEVCSRCEKQLEYDDYLTFTYVGDECSVKVKNINYVPEKVVIPDYVTSIEASGFKDCINILSIEIPDSVTFIGSSAFYGCSNLTSIEIPDSVISIGMGAFNGCSSLQSITIPFVGDKAGKTSSDTYQYPFGYIFGTSSYTGGTATEQDYYGWVTSNTTSSTYYIPTSLYEVTVTGSNILRGAFDNCSSLTSVVIGDSVTSIGDDAFSGCSSLTSVVIGDSVTSIGHYAFFGCSSLTSIEIPDSVTSIGSSAFSGCSSLTEVNYLGSIDDWAEIEFGIGASNPIIYAKQLKINGEVVTEVNLTSATKVSNYAFYYCSSLTSVEIPNTVTSIGSSAFSGCSSLTSIEIPNSVTSIGEGAFSGCSSLQSITIPFVGDRVGKTSSDTHQYPFGYIFGTSSYKGGTATEQDYYFWSTSNTTSSTYYIPTSLKEVTVTGSNILRGAFDNCSGLSSVVIGDSVTSIGSSAFSGCSGLTEVNYLGSIDDWTQIEFGSYNANPISYAKQLKINGEVVTEVNLTSATKISNLAFCGYDSLTSVVIDDSVTSIGNGAFSGCSSLTSVVIGDSVTSIGYWAFYGCSNLTSVVIPDSVTSIGEGAFDGCSSLQYNIEGELKYLGNKNNPCLYLVGVTTQDITIANINNICKFIGSEAFYDCSSLTSIVIPDSVTSFGDWAFRACSSLTSVEIPDSVTNIDSGAFLDCNNLKEVNYLGTIDQWAEIEFGSVDANPLYYAKQLKINGEVVTEVNLTTAIKVSSYAFSGCSSLTSIKIPDSVTSIGEGAFYGCSSLTSIKIPDSVTSIGGSAFYGCSSLTEITLPFVGSSLSATGYQSVFGFIFGFTTRNNSASISGATLQYSEYNSGEYTYYHYYIPSSLKKVTIISGSIGANAFYGCSGLTSVKIGDSVASIGSSAFNGCSSLTSVVIPDSVTSIGGSAFRGCSSLTEVNYLGAIDEWAEIKFSNYDSNPLYYAKQLKINGEVVTEVNLTTAIKVSSYAFSDCSGLTSVIIGDGVTSIGSDAFYNCSSLTSVKIGDSVTSIGWSAFDGCSSLTSVVIPDSVTSIGEGAFYGCSSLTSVVIPDSVTSIGSYAFYNCNSLTSIVIPDSVTSIGYSAFENCSSLTSIVIPDSVTSIDDLAFNGCSKLVEVINRSSYITVIKGDPSNGYIGYHALSVSNRDDSYVSKLTNDNGYIIYTEGEEKILVNYIGNETDLVLPSYITKINQYAFRNCNNLTSVVIGDSVTSIGGRAFYDCSSLTSIKIPNSVTSIGDYAFYYCDNLTSVVIGASVTSIGDYAFGGYSKIVEVINRSSYITVIKGDTSNGYIGYNALSVSNCDDDYVSKLSNDNGYIIYSEMQENILVSYIGDETDLVLPSYITQINQDAFYYDTNLTSVVIGDSVTSIGDYAFYRCSGLTSVVIPDSVTSIGDHAFYSCSSLTSVVIPNSVTSIGSFAFYDCSSLQYNIEGELKYLGNKDNPYLYLAGVTSNSITSANINNTCKFIGSSAFEGCSSLASIEIPDSVTSIGYAAFEECSSLTSVVIGDSVTSIGAHAFDDCSRLIEITVDVNNLNYSSVDGNLYSKDKTTLIQYAIGKTQSSFTIPNSVTSIGDHAFYYCDNLTSVVIGDSVTSIGYYAFCDCRSLTSIEIPDSVTSIGRSAFAHCSRLTSIVIPDSVTSIGDYAFYYCDNLTSVVIGASVTSIGSYAFYGCSSLTLIKYRGTQEQWNSISKDYGWNESTGNYTITYNYTGE